MKVNICDKTIIKEWFGVVGVMGLIVTIFPNIINIFRCFYPKIKLFLLEFPFDLGPVIVSIIQTVKKFISVEWLIVIILIYIYYVWKANRTVISLLTINGSLIMIEEGNIFDDSEEGLKVIAFNEYYDTIVDNDIILSSSINGMFIKNIVKNSIKELDNDILIDNYLNKYKLEFNNKRKKGKKQKYKLGSIHKYDDKYLITAMSEYDEDNKAILTQRKYVEFLFEFWRQLDKYNNNNRVIIPVLGAGITRFKDNREISMNELIKLMLITFKLSNIRLKGGIKIVIHSNNKDEIDFYHLKLFK